jgi:GNAT superfamily N-acetyltransferase
VVSIRDAQPADARAIAEVHVASWRWAYQDQLPESVLEALSVDEREIRWRERLRAPSSRSGCLVAELDGRVVGFASFGRGAEDNGPVVPGAGELYAIYLLREVRGVGIGRALMSCAEAGLLANGFEQGYLWVLETNDLARRFYEKAGWSWDGTTGEHRFDCGNRPIVRYVQTLGQAATSSRAS